MAAVTEARPEVVSALAEVLAADLARLDPAVFEAATTQCDALVLAGAVDLRLGRHDTSAREVIAAFPAAFRQAQASGQGFSGADWEDNGARNPSDVTFLFGWLQAGGEG